MFSFQKSTAAGAGGMGMGTCYMVAQKGANRSVQMAIAVLALMSGLPAETVLGLQYITHMQHTVQTRHRVQRPGMCQRPTAGALLASEGRRV